MNEIDTKICGNILDALDRLFDRESEVIDIYALIFASNVALKGSISELDLTNIAIALDKIARNGKTEDLQHEEALQITNKLRVALNDLLPI